MTTRFRPAAFA